jgi:heterodisulfide reductase subunit C
MEYVSSILFVSALILGIGFFVRNIKRLRASISQGKSIELNGSKKERLKQMLLIAIGQSKMVKKPIAGILHIIVYVGFIIINIEVLEIVIDGILGTHRIFSSLGIIYDLLIASFEYLALGVIVAVVLFWIRRNVIRINRFIKSEMKGWPKLDANLILYIELVLMSLFLLMNAADFSLQQLGAAHYTQAGSFPISSNLVPFLESFSADQLMLIERTAWWLHILGILGFLNYLYYSKHLHILLAFPNTYYGKLTPKGQLSNDSQVASEVAQMMDPNFDPYAAAPVSDTAVEPFGASDVSDLSWVQLMNAYSCTECGRCTASCPANLTGKKLSPRNIMMKVRDRAEEASTLKRTSATDTKKLLGDYITPEELWACTSCNACVEACPISIDPLSIIVDMRRYLVMEQSAAPTELNSMMTNIETNGAPWPFNQLDRANWTNE